MAGHRPNVARPRSGWQTATVPSPPRVLLALGAAFALLLAGPAGPARAQSSATFDTTVLLGHIPIGPALPFLLSVSGEFSDSDGIDAQPILQSLRFTLPDAIVNAVGVPTCSAEPIVSVANDYDPCPRRLAVGRGTSDVQLRRPLGIDLRGHAPFYDYHLRMAMYIGPRTSAGRVLMVIGNGINSPLTVIMRGVLRHVASGWVYDLPIPVVSDPEIGVMKVERFAMTVGGWTRSRPRRRFIEAPRSCPVGGWAFGMQTQFDGAALLSATRGIACELRGV